MFIKGTLYSLVFFLPLLVLAQSSKTGPEQNCTGALPICTSFILQTSSYTGPGTNPNELPDSTCLKNGKNNAVWYIFTTTCPGILQFNLKPLKSTDDYDFALFNITGHTCADIRTIDSLEVRCNYTLNDSLVGDSTGIGNSYGGYGTSSPASGPAFNWSDTVGNIPQTFVLLVNDFTSGGSGYTLDFTRSTTCIVDTVKPKIASVDTSFCNTPTDSIIFQFSRPVLCDSIIADGSQFTITGPGGTAVAVDSAYDIGCIGSTEFTTTVIIRLKTPITVSGNYSISVHQGDNGTNANNGSHIIDICNDELNDTTWVYNQKPVLTPNFTWTYLAACHVDTVNFSTIVGPDDSIFYWSFGDGTFSTDTIPPPHLYPDTGNYTVILTDSSQSCTAADTQNVHVGSTFYAFLISGDTACAGTPLLFRDSIAGGSSTLYYYDINGKFFINPPNHDTTYTFTTPGIDTAKLIVTTSGGQACPDTVIKLIVVDSLVSANFVINPLVVCQGTPITFTDASTGGPTSWLWNFGTGATSTQQNASYTYDSIGVFDITFQVSNTCNTSDTGLNATVKKVPSFSLGKDTSICLPDSILLTAYPGADSIMWSNGDTTATIYFKNVPATVSVRVVKNGCPFETSIMIGEQEDGCITVSLPTAFTPNGSGNDVWRLVHPERIQDVVIKIYNRWGQLVFSSDDVNFEWDGTFNGEKAPMAVYTWFAIVTGLSGQNEFFKGNVTLIR